MPNASERFAQAVRNTLIFLGAMAALIIVRGGSDVFENFRGWDMQAEQVQAILGTIGTTLIWLALIYFVIRPIVLFGVEYCRAQLEHSLKEPEVEEKKNPSPPPHIPRLPSDLADSGTREV